MTVQEILALPKAKKFLDAVAVRSENTSNTYVKPLNYFQNHVITNYKQTIESIINPLLDKKIDVYDLLQGLVYHFVNAKLATRTVHGYMAAVKSYLQQYDVEIDPRKFKRKVKIPAIEEEDEEELDPKIIRQILLSTSNRRLKAYQLCLGSGGFRALEACAIRICDCHFEVSPTRIHIRKEFAKRKRARDVYISDEARRFLQEWIAWKYRKKGSNYRTFVKDDNDLVFTTYGKQDVNGKEIRPKGIYNRLRQEFANVLSAIKLDARKDGMLRRKITLHSYRRTVYTTISNNFGQDFADGFLGHKKTSYHTMKEEKRREIYARDLMKHLTYLDYTTIDDKLKKETDEMSQLKQQVQSLLQYKEQKDAEIESLETRGADIDGKIKQKDERIASLEKQVKSLQESKSNSIEVESLNKRMDTIQEQLKGLAKGLVDNNPEKTRKVLATIAAASDEELEKAAQKIKEKLKEDK